MLPAITVIVLAYGTSGNLSVRRDGGLLITPSGLDYEAMGPGDIVSLGTAFKPGATRKSIHHANFQNVAGPVSVTIEGLGRQSNPVVLEDRPLARWRLA